MYMYMYLHYTYTYTNVHANMRACTRTCTRICMCVVNKLQYAHMHKLCMQSAHVRFSAELPACLPATVPPSCTYLCAWLPAWLPPCLSAYLLTSSALYRPASERLVGPCFVFCFNPKDAKTPSAQPFRHCFRSLPRLEALARF